MLKYYLPDWEDRLDPGYDFLTDSFSSGHLISRVQNDKYVHQLYQYAPYDGLLVSLNVLDNGLNHSKSILQHQPDGRYLIRKEHGVVRDFLSLESNPHLRVIGDCGAFSYVNEYEPPERFNTRRVVDLYDKLGFDYGVSVDHLIVDSITKRRADGGTNVEVLTQYEKRQRIKITRRNATAFIKRVKEKKCNFTPLGVAQGFDLKTYKESVVHLIDKGYDYIGIGSLVQHKTDFILDVLREIETLINGKEVHLFGVLRPRSLAEFQRLGVTSFDSASYLRKAWLRSGQNYLSVGGKWYAAIRVPYSDDKRLAKNADFNGYSEKDVRSMERAALNALFDYDRGRIGVERTIRTVIAYDNLLLRNTEELSKLEERYRTTLVDRPWAQCSCPICQELGINVVIFRGLNRNKRRGFHNIYTFKAMGTHSQSDVPVGAIQDTKIEDEGV